MVVNSPLIRPYFLGEVALGGSYCYTRLGVVFYFLPHTVHAYSGLFNCSFTTLGGIVMMDFHGILRKESCNMKSKQT